MPGLAEIAAVMITGAQRRIEITASNVSNVSTPGYQPTRIFSQILDARAALPVDATVRTASSEDGVLKPTGNPLDLASSSGSVMLFATSAGYRATRSAQLRRDGEGYLIDGQGARLQAAGGGDLVVGQGALQILPNGVVLVEGQPEARIGLFVDSARPGSPDSGPGGAAGAFVAELPDASEEGAIYQGMIVPSGVDLGSEMVELTRAGRQAETGAKIFQLYDDLLGKATNRLAEIGA